MRDAERAHPARRARAGQQHCREPRGRWRRQPVTAQEPAQQTLRARGSERCASVGQRGAVQRRGFIAAAAPHRTGVERRELVEKLRGLGTVGCGAHERRRIAGERGGESRGDFVAQEIAAQARIGVGFVVDPGDAVLPRVVFERRARQREQRADAARDRRPARAAGIAASPCGPAPRSSCSSSVSAWSSAWWASATASASTVASAEKRAARAIASRLSPGARSTLHAPEHERDAAPRAFDARRTRPRHPRSARGRGGHAPPKRVTESSARSPASASSSTIESRPPDSATAMRDARPAAAPARSSGATPARTAAVTGSERGAPGAARRRLPGGAGAADPAPPGSAGGELLELAIGEDLVLARVEHRVDLLLLQLAQRFRSMPFSASPSSRQGRGARRRAAR